MSPGAAAAVTALRLTLVLLPTAATGSSVKDVVGAAKGGIVEVSVRAKANGPRVSSASSSLRALPSSGVGVGSAPIPGGSHAAMLLKEALVAAPCKPKTPVTNTEGSDTMHSTPSSSDRVACGLGPLTIPVSGLLAKPSSAAHLDFPKLGTNFKRFS
ncbi:hypothetical protein SUGI_0509250 [Cryptomeria japonica]|nr:hypothetical protein SUGI_0509250 [Cryptomeria japonica]